MSWRILRVFTKVLGAWICAGRRQRLKRLRAQAATPADERMSDLLEQDPENWDPAFLDAMRGWAVQMRQSEAADAAAAASTGSAPMELGAAEESASSDGPKRPKTER